MLQITAVDEGGKPSKGLLKGVFFDAPFAIPVALQNLSAGPDTNEPGNDDCIYRSSLSGDESIIFPVPVTLSSPAGGDAIVLESSALAASAWSDTGLQFQYSSGPESRSVLSIARYVFEKGAQGPPVAFAMDGASFGTVTSITNFDWYFESDVSVPHGPFRINDSGPSPCPQLEQAACEQESASCYWSTGYCIVSDDAVNDSGCYGNYDVASCQNDPGCAWVPGSCGSYVGMPVSLHIDDMQDFSVSADFDGDGSVDNQEFAALGDAWRGLAFVSRYGSSTTDGVPGVVSGWEGKSYGDLFTFDYAMDAGIPQLNLCSGALYFPEGLNRVQGPVSIELKAPRFDFGCYGTPPVTKVTSSLSASEPSTFQYHGDGGKIGYVEGGVTADAGDGLRVALAESMLLQLSGQGFDFSTVLAFPLDDFSLSSDSLAFPDFTWSPKAPAQGVQLTNLAPRIPAPSVFAPDANDHGCITLGEIREDDSTPLVLGNTGLGLIPDPDGPAGEWSAMLDIATDSSCQLNLEGRDDSFRGLLLQGGSVVHLAGAMPRVGTLDSLIVDFEEQSVTLTFEADAQESISFSGGDLSFTEGQLILSMNDAGVFSSTGVLNAMSGDRSGTIAAVAGELVFAPEGSETGTIPFGFFDVETSGYVVLSGDGEAGYGPRATGAELRIPEELRDLVGVLPDRIMLPEDSLTSTGDTGSAIHCVDIRDSTSLDEVASVFPVGDVFLLPEAEAGRLAVHVNLGSDETCLGQSGDGLWVGPGRWAVRDEIGNLEVIGTFSSIRLSVEEGPVQAQALIDGDLSVEGTFELLGNMFEVPEPGSLSMGVGQEGLSLTGNIPLVWPEPAAEEPASNAGTLHGSDASVYIDLAEHITDESRGVPMKYDYVIFDSEGPSVYADVLWPSRPELMAPDHEHLSTLMTSMLRVNESGPVVDCLSQQLSPNTEMRFPSFRIGGADAVFAGGTGTLPGPRVTVALGVDDCVDEHSLPVNGISMHAAAFTQDNETSSGLENAQRFGMAHILVDASSPNVPWRIDIAPGDQANLQIAGASWQPNGGGIVLREEEATWVSEGSLSGALQRNDVSPSPGEAQNVSLTLSAALLSLSPIDEMEAIVLDKPGLEVRTERISLVAPSFELVGARVALVDSAVSHVPLTSDRRRHDGLAVTQTELDFGCLLLDEEGAATLPVGPFALVATEAPSPLDTYLVTPNKSRCPIAAIAESAPTEFVGVWIASGRMALPNIQGTPWPFAAAQMNLTLDVDGHLSGSLSTEYDIAPDSFTLLGDELTITAGAGNAALEAEGWNFSSLGIYEGTWGDQPFQLPFELVGARGLMIGADAELEADSDGFTVSGFQLAFDHFGTFLLNGSLLLPSPLLSAFDFLSALTFDEIEIGALSLSLGCLDVSASLPTGTFDFAPLSLSFGPDKGRMFLLAAGETCSFDSGDFAWPAFDVNTIRIFGADVGFLAQPGFSFAGLGSLDISLPGGEDFSIDGNIPVPDLGRFAFPFFGVDLNFSVPGPGLSLSWNDGLQIDGLLSASLPFGLGDGDGLDLELDFDDLGRWPRFRIGTGEPIRVSAGPFRLHIGEIRLPRTGISLQGVRFEMPSLFRDLFGDDVGAAGDPLDFTLPELDLGIGRLANALDLDFDLSAFSNEGCPTFQLAGLHHMGAFEVQGELEFVLDLSKTERCPNAGLRYDYLPAGEATANAARGFFAREKAEYVRFAGSDDFHGKLAGVHLGFAADQTPQLFGRVELVPGAPMAWTNEEPGESVEGRRTTLQFETGHFELSAAGGIRFVGTGLDGTGQLQLLEQRGNPGGNYYFEGAGLSIGTQAPRFDLFVSRMWTGAQRDTPIPFEMLSGETSLSISEFGLDLSVERNLDSGPVPADLSWQGLVLNRVEGELALPGAGHTHSLLFGTEPLVPGDAQSDARGLAIPWQSPHQVSGHLYFAGNKPFDLSNQANAAADEIGLGGTQIKLRVSSGWVQLAAGRFADGNLRASFKVLNRWVEAPNVGLSSDGLYVELNPQEGADSCAFADLEEGAEPDSAGFGFTLPGGIGVAVEQGPIVIDLHAQLNPPGIPVDTPYFGTVLGQVGACLPPSRFQDDSTGQPVRLTAQDFEVGSTGVSGLFRYDGGRGRTTALSCDELRTGAGAGDALPISMVMGTFRVGLAGFAARVDGNRLVGIEADGRATIEPWIDELPFRLGYGASSDELNLGFCFSEGTARETALGDVVTVFLDSVVLEASGARAALRFDGGIGFGGEELDVAQGEPIITFQDFAIFSDGTVELPQWGTGDGWIGLEEHTAGLLAGFPLALERTRLVSVKRPGWERTGYQIDLGMRLQLGDLLQTETGNLGATLGFVFLPPANGEGWKYGVTVEGLAVQMGYPDWIDFSGDVSYRDAMFTGSMDLSLANMPFDAHAGVQVFGRYANRPCAGWRVHGMVSRLRPVIPLGTTPVMLTGFGGGISYHMVPPGLDGMPDTMPNFFSDEWVPACRQGVGIQAMTAFGVSGVPEDLLNGKVGASLLLSPTRFDLFGQVAFLEGGIADGIRLPGPAEELTSAMEANQTLEATLCAQAFIGLDISEGALDGRATLGCGDTPAIDIGSSGWRLLSMRGHAGLHLSGRRFFLEIGNRDRKVQATALPDWLDTSIDSFYYLGTDAWEAGAGASAGFGTWDIWICEVGAKGSVEGDAGLRFRQSFALQAGVAGRLKIDACIASVNLDASLRLYLPRDPYYLTGNFRVRKRMPWYLPDINFGLDFSAP